MIEDVLACTGIAILYTFGALIITFIILIIRIKKRNKNKN